ncbi:MAG TPA: LPS export ABC transporter periplasmic protein LptC [Ignavibacteriaceae bacterium]|jgi:LPS export ABC transporter protein LptC|nr:LPS export ABC transporter periplasmic protein LptC [Ignavibacteriaceae bacterium]
MKYPVLIILLLFIAGCGSEKVKPKIDTSLKVEELPAQESWDSNIIFTDSGRTQAVMWVGHLRMFTQAQETLIDSNLKVDFYNPQQIKTTTLTSRRGRVDDKTKNLYAIENVVAVNDSGITLETEELMWRNSDSRIVSDKFVTINTPTEKIQGYGFESDQHLKNYIIYKVTYVTNQDSL